MAHSGGEKLIVAVEKNLFELEADGPTNEGGNGGCTIRGLSFAGGVQVHVNENRRSGTYIRISKQAWL